MSTGNDRVNERPTTENSREMRFRTTQWQLVLDSQNCNSPRHCEALAELCSLYWYPLYAFARRKGLEAQDAEDLTQSFFLHLLEKGALQQVRAGKGRFRCFLLASFRNHISVWRQHQVAAKRGGGCRLFSLDAPRAEERYDFEPAADWTAERLFDAHWAKLLLDRVMRRLSEDYRRKGKQMIFERLSGHLRVESELEARSYEASAKVLGLSVAGAKTLVFRMRKHFGRLLREEVARTVVDPADIDAEIRALYQALIAAEGRF
jgi:DNA-directed RNA polymerase specialized sigma24 family protein